ncbi:9037_t:CDS:2 [Gigaspora margarita]|uniref:9037_t:CDS:1 n=1 Tax=Gigaspora margarita TaxID=4874 RepID=A0ABN7V3K3_GIGMA|nr:9037_t:CDS:2 [Gigaspora margarita]
MSEYLKNYCHVFMFDAPILNYSNEKNDFDVPILNCSNEINDIDARPRKRARRQNKVKRVPRPPNAFILYRTNKHLDVKAQNKNLTNAQVSKVISQMWKNEKNEIKLYWEKLADNMKLNHMKNYPDYVYKPKKRTTTSDTSKNSSKINMINNMIKAKTSSTPPKQQLFIDPSLSDIYQPHDDIFILMQHQYQQLISFEKEIQNKSLSDLCKDIDKFCNLEKKIYKIKKIFINAAKDAFEKKQDLKDVSKIFSKFDGRKNDFTKIYSIANYYLGCCYENGYGLNKDERMAKTFLKFAAIYDSLEAKKKLLHEEKWKSIRDIMDWNTSYRYLFV